MLWQLKKISTNQALNEPQKLPENWGPIFGLPGIQDRIGDLSWLGEAYADQGWVVVEGEAPTDPVQSTQAELAWEKAKRLLQESDWAVLSDVPMNKTQKTLWIEYRRGLREVRLQPEFPSNINWPTIPV
jgi:hypothetical protein